MSVQTINKTEIRAGLVEVNVFDIVGVSVVTTNENNQAASDINILWERVFREQIGQKLEERVDDTLYCVYSDYQGDHTQPYRVTIGYRVSRIENLPKTLHTVRVEHGSYVMMSATGPQPQALLETWEAIWSSDLERTFQTDFEVYGPRFFEDGVHEVLVHVGINTD